MSSPVDMMNLQRQVRQNATELNDFLRDMDSWEEDIKKKDEVYNKMKPKNQEKVLQPIRKAVAEQKKLQKPKEHEETKNKKAKRIRSGDYRSWDKLNIDGMLEEMDQEEEQEKKEIEIESEKQKIELSVKAKDEGNIFFKSGLYEKAVAAYTKAMEYDPSNAVFPANRAMAYFKLKKYMETEADCTFSLSLDPTYTKAYLRRGCARYETGKLDSAIRDFNDALKLEPNNKQALRELEKINKCGTGTGKEDSKNVKPREKKVPVQKCVVQPITKPKHLQSKKPLRRIQVEEILPYSNKPSQDTMEIQIPSPKPTSENEPVKMINSENSYKTNTAINCKSESKSDVKVIEPETSSIPAKPTTCFQFQASLRKLQQSSDLTFTYLHQIHPDTLNQLLKDQLEPSILTTIVRCFQKHFEKDEDFVVAFLKSMSSARRFDMVIMFLSNSDQKDVKLLFEHMERCYSKDQEQIRILAKKYCV